MASPRPWEDDAVGSSGWEDDAVGAPLDEAGWEVESDGGGTTSGSDSESDKDEDPALSFVRVMIDLLIGRSLNARQFCLLMYYAGKAGIPSASKHGLKPGSPSGHYQRHVRTSVGCEFNDSPGWIHFRSTWEVQACHWPDDQSCESRCCVGRHGCRYAFGSWHAIEARGGNRRRIVSTNLRSKRHGMNKCWRGAGSTLQPLHRRTALLADGFCHRSLDYQCGYESPTLRMRLTEEVIVQVRLPRLVLIPCSFHVPPLRHRCACVRHTSS